MAVTDGCAWECEGKSKMITIEMGTVVLVVKIAQTVPYFFQFLLFKLFPNISFTFHPNPRAVGLAIVSTIQTRNQRRNGELVFRHQRNKWAWKPHVLTHSLMFFPWHYFQVSLARFEGKIQTWAPHLLTHWSHKYIQVYPNVPKSQCNFSHKTKCIMESFSFSKKILTCAVFYIHLLKC